MSQYREEETYEIIGICMEVHRNLGPGLLEIVYKDALEIELKDKNIPFEREKGFFIEYKGRILPHKFYADFIVNEDIILEVKATKEFSHTNGIELVCRAHQLVMEGYKYHFPEKSLVTVWSAPNYCYRCGNVASVLAIDEYLQRDFKLFHDVPEPNDSHDVQHRNVIPYFL